MTQKQIKAQRTEELQDYFASKRIHKALEGKLGEPTADTIERLRKEGKRYAN